MPSSRRNSLPDKPSQPKAGIHKRQSHPPAEQRSKNQKTLGRKAFRLPTTEEGLNRAPASRAKPEITKSLSRKASELGSSQEEGTFLRSYLLSQRGVLYFRMRVPKGLQECLGCTEYRRSLGTAMRREARPQAIRLALAAQDIFTCTREYLTMNKKTRNQPTPETKEGGTPRPRRTKRPSIQGDFAFLAALTPEKIRELAHRALNRNLEEAYEVRLLRREPNLQKEQNDLETSYLEMLHQIDEERAPGAWARHEADAVLAEEGIAPLPASPAEQEERSRTLPYRKLCDKLQRAGAACIESQLAPCWDGSLRQAPAQEWNVSIATSFIQERQETALAAAAPSPVLMPQPMEAAMPETPCIPLREAVAKFIEIRREGWTDKATAMDIPKRLETFLAIVDNGETPLTFESFAVNRDAVRRYHRILTSIPVQYSKKEEYRGMDFDALAALNVPPERRFARETLKNQFNTVKGFLSWAEEEGYLQRSSKPFKTVLTKLPETAKPSKRRAFTTAELKDLFAPKLFQRATAALDAKRPWKFWTPLLALFTGARLEELCQLELNDIRQDPDSGLWCIHITDQGDPEEGGRSKSVKTKAGRRIVPLHPFLTSPDSPANVLAYAEALRDKGETRLFPMLKENSRGNVSDAVSKWFGHYRRKCGVGAGKDELSEVSFHSFRHTVITTATKYKEVDRRKVKQMVGHEAGLNEAADITTRYEGDYPLSTIARDVVGALDFDETLDLRALLQR